MLPALSLINQSAGKKFTSRKTKTALLPSLSPTTTPKVSFIPGQEVVLKASEFLNLSNHTKLYSDGQDMHVLTSAPNATGWFQPHQSTLNLTNLTNQGNFFYPETPLSQDSQQMEKFLHPPSTTNRSTSKFPVETEPRLELPIMMKGCFL